MGKSDFNKIRKTLKVGVTATGSTTASVEVDFDLPRGYIAKILDASLQVTRLGGDFQTISADKYAQVVTALVLDPDDTTSVTIPNATIDHDVLMDHEVDISIVAGTTGDPGYLVTPDTYKYQQFTEMGQDVFTARNMRLNVDAQEADAADITECVIRCTIGYTLERIKDADLMDLLGLL